MQGIFHQGDQYLAPIGQGWGFEKGLFVFRLEGAQHGDGIDQQLFIRAFHAFPIRFQPLDCEIAAQKAHEMLTGKARVMLWLPEIALEILPAYIRAQIGGEARNLPLHPKTRDAPKRDHVAAIVQLREGDHPPGATDLMQLWRGGVIRGVDRLDHPDQAMRRFQHIIEHGQIAGLEDVQRQLPARQDDSAREGEQREGIGQVSRGKHAPTIP